MNVRVPSISFINPQACFRYPILFGQRDSEAENQRTIRIFNCEHQQQQQQQRGEQSPTLPTPKPSSPLKFTSARSIHYKRSTPYERPIENKLKEKEEEKPLKITRTITTAIEISRPFSYMERPIVEKGIKALTEDYDDSPVTIDIKDNAFCSVKKEQTEDKKTN